MGDFEIYADALEHPLLQRFNDLLSLLSLSHYVNFPSCKMGHTLELGMLLNLHHGNILLLFSFVLVSSCSPTPDFSPFLAFPVVLISVNKRDRATSLLLVVCLFYVHYIHS